MRAAAIPILGLPLVLLNHCGSKADLIIGEIQIVSAAGKASVPPTAGSGGETSTAGTAQGATGGTDVAGSGGTTTPPVALLALAWAAKSRRSGALCTATASTVPARPSSTASGAPTAIWSGAPRWTAAASSPYPATAMANPTST
jgi:hypothetical protein